MKTLLHLNITVETMSRRVFNTNKGTYNLYSNDEKLQLAELVAEKKEEYDANVALNEWKTRYDNERKNHVAIKPTGGYLAKAVQEFYPDLAKARNDDPNFCKAVKLAARYYNEIEQLRDASTCAPAKKRAIGGGRKSKAPEVREALFSWFIDVRESLKGHLPRHLFKLKANALYEEWLRDNPTPESEKLKLGISGSRCGKKNMGLAYKNRANVTLLKKKIYSPPFYWEIWSRPTYYQWRPDAAASKRKFQSKDLEL